MKFLKKLASGWSNFWFSPIDLYNVALFRMILGVTLLVMYLLRFQDFNLFYGDVGVVPGSLANLILPPSHQSPFPFYFVSESLALYAHVLFLVLLLGFALGLFSRSLTWLVFLLHLSFMQRNFTIIYGADLFANFWLLYLSLVNHNRYFSILNIGRPKLHHQINLPQIDSDLLSTVGVRLIQVQLCLSYAYTGIEKLKGSVWWEGVAVWHVLGIQELMSMDLTFLQSFPLIIGALTMMTVIFEIYFPAAVLSDSVRPYWLMIGLGFHGSTAIFMNLPFFCLVMIAAYLLFIDSKSLRFAVYRFRGIARALF